MKIDLEVHHYLHPAPGTVPDDLAALFRQLKGEIVSQLSDKIAAVSTSMDAAVGRIQEDVAALQALAASGGATQADLDALDALKARLDAIDPVKPVTPPAPAPTPAPA